MFMISFGFVLYQKLSLFLNFLCETPFPHRVPLEHLNHFMKFARNRKFHLICKGVFPAQFARIPRLIPLPLIDWHGSYGCSPAAMYTSPWAKVISLWGWSSVRWSKYCAMEMSLSHGYRKRRLVTEKSRHKEIDLLERKDDHCYNKNWKHHLMDFP